MYSDTFPKKTIEPEFHIHFNAASARFHNEQFQMNNIQAENESEKRWQQMQNAVNKLSYPFNKKCCRIRILTGVAAVTDGAKFGFRCNVCNQVIADMCYKLAREYYGIL